MTTRHDWNSELEAYLDGLLEGEDLRQFKVRLNSDESLQRALRQQRMINAAIRRSFAPPDRPQFMNGLHPAVGNGAAAHNGNGSAHTNGLVMTADASPVPTKSAPGLFKLQWRRYAAAAAMLLLLGGAWLAWTLVYPSHAPPSPQTPRQIVRMSFDQVYQRLIDDEYEPAWVCNDNEEFAGSFRNRFGQPLLLRPLPEHISASGISYSNSITDHTFVVLMRVDGREVIVLADRVSSDSGPKDNSDDLNIFRRVIDDLVLYEISPLPESRVLEFFFNPDAESPDSSGEMTWH